jgi:uncharacterized cupredoxin-like copper-binding protein
MAATEPRRPLHRAAPRGDKRALKSVVLAAAVVLSTAALAHEGADHKKTPGPAKKEQKAWGVAGDAKNAKKTIEVGMADNMRFTPDRFEVRQGETVRFVVRNTGQQMHEFVIGTKAENDKHAELMIKFPNMEHDEPYMAHVPAGKSGEIVWTFNRAGDFDFACLIAGHYQAGMVGHIKVIASSRR